MLIGFLLLFQLFYFLSTWKLYTLSGRKIWEAAIPVYSLLVLLRLIRRPWWWLILLVLPVVNLLMIPAVWIETLRSFGKTSRTDALICLLSLGGYIAYLNYFGKDLTHRPERDPNPKSALGDWVSSLVFAIVLASLVHTYFMQPYVIPTSSLEKTLLVGDFVLVSKFHFGARAPMTPLALPMMHDTIPLLKIRSYLNQPQLPYFRLPGLQQIKKNDIIVYNWPADTVQQFFTHTDRIIKKPVDKKSNYVKRCVATPGDTLEIKNGYVYINGRPLQLSDRAKPQYAYLAKTRRSFGPKELYRKYGITDRYYPLRNNGIYFPGLTEVMVAKMKKDPDILSLEKKLEPAGEFDPGTFPHHENFAWNGDNFGPLVIPKKGTTIRLTKSNLPLYKRLITVYEGKTLAQKEGEILINDQPADSYTFSQNYYWGMGDNRHNSEDSRSWGFIPHDHIVGKPVFIWFSFDTHAQNLFEKIRWKRLFTTVGGSGKPVSYLWWFIGLLAAIRLGQHLWKGRKTTMP
ncbi:signal peptidase I [Sediminicola luteus]|uniref:Signal peptidase I n=1 Tax=Sediminicola luteus TaxID=319238 RepID=A0A2A4G779_9FLAO|nr:signal peptidase I [Sediminicola luteus]PCE64497.1 signal peptidase I [Sediminicola luteus]